MREPHLFYLVAVLQNNPILEVFDIYHNELITFKTDVQDEEFIYRIANRNLSNGDVFRIKSETKQAIWCYLKTNKKLRKLITTHDKDIHIKDDLELSASTST